jgi:hypothetical protein
MAKPSRQNLTHASVTSLRRFGGHLPLSPSGASTALRRAAAALLLAAAVALPCAVLYRATVETMEPIHVPRVHRPLLPAPPLPPVQVPEDDSDFDPFPTGDLVWFAFSLYLCFFLNEFVNFFFYV